MDSSIGERAEKCIEFAEELSQITGIPHTMRDERLTTVTAHNALNVTNTRGKKRKAIVDQVAAVVILQDYIDFRRINNIKIVRSTEILLGRAHFCLLFRLIRQPFYSY